jgi:hypothetical protein
LDDFAITPLDAGTVAIVVFLVQALKKYIMPRWVPVLPFLIGWILAVPVIFITKGPGLAISVFISNVFLEGLKMAILSMAVYKVGFTTIAGKDSKNYKKKKENSSI